MFYPEPAFISAVVSLALLLPLPPLYQAGGVVSRQADVTAAGCGTDSSPDASGEEGLRAEWQLHATRQWHKEWSVGADPVWTLSVVWREGDDHMGGSHMYTHTRTHTDTKEHKTTHANMQQQMKKSVKKHQSLSLKKTLEKNQWHTAADYMNAMNTSLAFCMN